MSKGRDVDVVLEYMSMALWSYMATVSVEAMGKATGVM